MADNVIPWGGSTRLDIPTEKILAGAAKAKLTECIIIGTNAAGEEFLFSTTGRSPVILWYLERAKHNLIKDIDD